MSVTLTSSYLFTPFFMPLIPFMIALLVMVYSSISLLTALCELIKSEIISLYLISLNKQTYLASSDLADVNTSETVHAFISLSHYSVMDVGVTTMSPPSIRFN
ncbi:hypothetical protein B9Z55_003147 [Caenorhabditis nigoni]|uniref:Uncharacterized protein n=1 Tax=Caenorhabditis nigoni TaxID=1611254 RepID=A0A2G5VNU6_9PELO|nr:hypothetical protein B9Z55_003147 [Caenorhabditis nigoni]